MKLKMTLLMAVQALTLVWSLEDQRMLFANAGYVEVRLFEESKGWFCGVGQKP